MSKTLKKGGLDQFYYNRGAEWPDPFQNSILYYIVLYFVSFHAQNPNSATTGLNLNKIIWVGHENNFAHHHPTTQSQHQQYLSCYWPDFDQTLNKGSWEHIQQITTVTTTFVQATFVLGTFVHIRNISAVTDPILMKLYR